MSKQDRYFSHHQVGWTRVTLQDKSYCFHSAWQFAMHTSGRSPWWSCPGEMIDRLFVVLPQSRQVVRFDQLSRQRWLYRLALGQPHQQDFIETVSQLPDDGRHKYALCLSAWKNGSS